MVALFLCRIRWRAGLRFPDSLAIATRCGDSIRGCERRQCGERRASPRVTSFLPDSFRRLGVLDRLPDVVRRCRHLDVVHAVVAQRVDDGADDHRRRRGGAAFAARLDAERIGGRQHLGDFGRERRQRIRAWQAVVYERTHQRLAAVALHVALLPQGLPDALRDRAVGLAMNDQRIDAAADIVDRRIAGEHHRAGGGVDLDLADGASIGKHRIVHLVVGDHRDAVLELARKRVSRRLLGKLEKVEGAVGLARAESAVVEFDLVRRRPRTTAATCLPFATRSGSAFANSVAAWRMERPECEPPPRRTTSVSPRMMFTLSTGTCRRSDMTCAKLVSWPWPLGCVPMTTSTRPSARTLIRACSLGAPIEDST